MNFFKIIYVDVDYLLMINIDELFDILDDFVVVFCVRLGVFDFCFNVGFLVLRLDVFYYEEIMKFWMDIIRLDICLND